MPRPTEPVRRICYADDITMWASGVKISELEQKVNTYLTEMSRFLWENSLLISAPKSSVTLFTPDPAQANTLKIADSELPHVHTALIYWSLRTSSQQSQQKKQCLEGIGRHQLGTAKGDFTGDNNSIKSEYYTEKQFNNTYSDNNNLVYPSLEHKKCAFTFFRIYMLFRYVRSWN